MPCECSNAFLIISIDGLAYTIVVEIFACPRNLEMIEIGMEFSSI